mmetsp:Transcript_8573/g.17356  ORF Transcript_8573/g.17356 Transcript_8573/m.17356 type:complete len:80 (-) Transcript_8573:104-343(-)
MRKLRSNRELRNISKSHVLKYFAFVLAGHMQSLVPRPIFPPPIHQPLKLILARRFPFSVAQMLPSCQLFSPETPARELY